MQPPKQWQRGVRFPFRPRCVCGTSWGRCLEYIGLSARDMEDTFWGSCPVWLQPGYLQLMSHLGLFWTDKFVVLLFVYFSPAFLTDPLSTSFLSVSLPLSFHLFFPCLWLRLSKTDFCPFPSHSLRYLIAFLEILPAIFVGPVVITCPWVRESRQSPPRAQFFKRLTLFLCLTSFLIFISLWHLYQLWIML